MCKLKNSRWRYEFRTWWYIRNCRIIVAFVILLITFGSLIAAGMPIISAIIGLGSSVGIIALLTYIFDIPNFTLTLAVMIGLAVGIDYSLFILFRFKELKKKVSIL